MRNPVRVAFRPVCEWNPSPLRLRGDTYLKFFELGPTATNLRTTLVPHGGMHWLGKAPPPSITRIVRLEAAGKNNNDFVGDTSCVIFL